MQRYKFESKSQLSGYIVDTISVVSVYAKIQIWKQITTHRHMETYLSGCKRICKDTNLKANHNNVASEIYADKVVSVYAKIQIWKQITTTSGAPASGQSCKRICKDTNLKANHNVFDEFLKKHTVVSVYAKIQIWKQITTR